MVFELQIDVSAFVQLELKCPRATIDDTAINEFLKGFYVTSLASVAKVFGVSYVTVKTSWRPGGMPGDAKAKKWIIADILIWLLKRNNANATSRGTDEFTERKRDAESRIVEAEARIKERKANVVEGEYIPLAVAVSVVKGYANKLRDGLMGVARRMQPMFPAKYQAQLTEEVDRYHRNLLTAFADTSISDLRQAANERDPIDVDVSV